MGDRAYLSPYSNAPVPGPDIFTQFTEKVRDFTRISLAQEDERNFILPKPLLRWLREEAQGGGGGTNVGQLLMGAYNGVPPPNLIKELKASMRRSDESCWLKVFVVLLLIKRGNYIDNFWSAGIVDKKLPVTRDILRKVISRLPSIDREDVSISQLVDGFHSLQFQLCTKDNLVKGNTLSEHCILPYCALEPVKLQTKDDSPPKIFQVQIPYDCLPERILNNIQEGHKSDGEAHQFALKILDNKRDYEQESFAYRALSGQRGIVRCLGWWEVQQPQGQSKYHLLLEYGWYDMDEYMENYPPPAFPKNIVKFWRYLLNVVKGLDTVHNFRDIVDEGEAYYYGWHGDIKPENILWYPQAWIIADPGFARFLRRNDKRLQFDHRRRPKIVLRGGTTTYGAPEQAVSKRAHVTQGVDIWSLGCVMSEAATWILLGYRGVEQYRAARYYSEADIRARGGRDESFHDGSGVSLAVRDWHTYLRQAVRKCDRVTLKIIDIIDKEMLLPDGSKRICASILYKDMDEMLVVDDQATWNQDEYDLPHYIQTAFSSEQMETLKKWTAEPATLASQRKTNRYKSTNYHSTSLQGHQGHVDSDLDPLLAPGVPGLATTQAQVIQESSAFSPPVALLGERLYTSRSNPGPVSTQDTLQYDDTCRSHVGPEPSNRGQSKEQFGYWEARHYLQQKGWIHSGVLELPAEDQDAPEHPSPAPLPSTPTKSKRHRKRLSNVLKNAIRFPNGPQDRHPSFGGAQAQVDSTPPEDSAQASKGDTPNETYRNDDLNDLERDIIFLVDNSPSMVPHWERLEDLMSVLVALLHCQDIDGMDLFSTSSTTSLGSYNLPKSFAEQLRRCKPSKLLDASTQDQTAQPQNVSPATRGTQAGAQVDGIMRTLQHILYQIGGRTPYREKVTLFVLTDGQWEDIKSSKHILLDLLSNTLETWEQNDFLKAMMEQRNISIQFIQFGNDDEVTSLFAEIDDNLTTAKGRPLRDIIDVEPANGNIRKMLLGSIQPDWDEANTGKLGGGEDKATTTQAVSVGHGRKPSHSGSAASPGLNRGPGEYDSSRDTAHAGEQFLHGRRSSTRPRPLQFNLDPGSSQGQVTRTNTLEYTGGQRPGGGE